MYYRFALAIALILVRGKNIKIYLQKLSGRPLWISGRAVPISGRPGLISNGSVSIKGIIFIPPMFKIWVVKLGLLLL